MLTKNKFFIAFMFAAFLYGNAANAQSENKYSTSLKEAVEKFSRAAKEKDTATFFSFLDNNLAITARAETQIIGPDLTGFRKMVKQQFTNTEMNTTNSYNIEEVKAGSVEPVWAGYDRGTFTQTAVSKDGKYNRKISGPYYRAWRISDNGQWKCYHIIYMAFTCEGNECK